MNVAGKIVYVLFIVAIVSPLIPVMFGWAKVVKGDAGRVPARLAVIWGLLTCSCTVLVVSFFVKGFLGANYSTTRKMIIGVNCLVAIIGIVVSAIQPPSRLRTAALLAATLLMFVWGLNAALSSVV